MSAAPAPTLPRCNRCFTRRSSGRRYARSNVLQNARPATFGDERPQHAAGLRVALFSGNYNYTRDGANKALNRLVGHLLDHGAAVRVYSPTGRRAAFDPASAMLPCRSSLNGPRPAL